MAVRRVFAAIDLPEDAKSEAAAYVDGLAAEFRDLRVGWVKPEKLHITLKFAGSIDEHELERLTSQVADAAAGTAPFAVTLARTGAFLKRRGSNVLWLGLEVDPPNALIDLARRLDDKQETRKFSPHLTIARLKEPQK